MASSDAGCVLWVGSLASSVTQGEVENFFKRFGPVTAVTVNRAPSGTDQYAHVHFRRAADAATAKFELDGVSWPGMTGGSRALKIQYSDSRSSGRASSRTDGSGAGSKAGRSKRGYTTWVGGLTLEVSEDDLWAEMQEYGRLLTVDLHLTQSGTAQFAIVGFASEADATAAVEELDGYRGLWISGGRPLKVDFAQLPKAGAGGKGKAGSDAAPAYQAELGVKEIRGYLVSKEPRSALLWVGNIGLHVDEARLKDCFSRFGKVEFLELHRPKEYVHQWAFVKLEAEEEAQRAMEALDGATDTPIGTDRGTLKLRYARPQGSSNGSATNGGVEEVQVSAQELAAAQRNLWIGNLVSQPSERTLEQVFSRFGKIERVKVTEGTLFAFVDYEEKLSAARALKALAGKSVPQLSGGRPLKVEYQQVDSLAAPAARLPSAAAARAAGSSGAQQREAHSRAEEKLRELALRAAPKSPRAASQPLSPQHPHPHPHQQQQHQHQQQRSQPGTPASVVSPHKKPPGEVLLHLIGGGGPWHEDGAAAPPSQAPLAAGAAAGGPPPAVPPVQPAAVSSAESGSTAEQPGAPPAGPSMPLQPLQATPGGPAPPGMPHPHVQPPQLPIPAAPQQQQQQQHPLPHLPAEHPPMAPPQPLQPPVQPQLPPAQQPAAAPAGSGPAGGGGGFSLHRCACCAKSAATHPGVVLQLCTGCGAVSYCGPECQGIDWQRGHYGDCQRLGALMRVLQGQSQCVALLKTSMEQPFGHDAALVKRVLQACAESELH